MERKFDFSVGEFYHIYNRGNNKSNIFLNDSDRKRFQKLLYLCNSEKPVVFKTIQGVPLDKIERGRTIVSVGAYCLMSNHFHLLLREEKEGGISMYVEKLLTAYSMYFNKKTERTGKLFEGRFKATHADSDEYLKYLFSYIHLNPIKTIDSKWKENKITDREKAKQYLANYSYSSYIDYIGQGREECVILDKNAFPEYFDSIKEFSETVNEWLSFKDNA